MSQKARRRVAGPGHETPGAPAIAGPEPVAAGLDAPPRQAQGSWPTWTARLVSCVLIYHFAAVVSGAFGVPPSSLLQRKVADLFTPYHDLVDQGYAYRYYAEPPPTPVITARLKFSGGQPERVIRIPDRALGGPRMRHQRQLALANSLFLDFQEAKHAPGGGAVSRLGAAYARRLCAAFPGCMGVTLHAQQHLIPDPEHVLEHLHEPGGSRFDLFDESLFTTPERIGDFPCDGS